MPPNNSLVLASTSDGKDEAVTKDNVHSSETANGILNRKNKNVLDAHDQAKNGLDVNGNNLISNTESKTMKEKRETEYKIEPAWINIIGFIYLHYGMLVGLTMVKPDAKCLFTFVFGIFSGYGITAGAHRLWAHGAYKANLPLRIFLIFWQTVAFQNSVYEWVRDHRVHHKFTDTNADPHNASRGFFFSHIGWLMCKKHPDVKKYGQKVDMSDLERDPIVMFQHKYYLILMPICCFIIPMAIPMLWGASLYEVTYINILRYMTVLHFTWLVNSYAHIWGNKPYDEFIKPADSYTVSLLAFGEGWHNYHHVFPYDYKTSEHGKYWCNYTTGFLDFMAWIGWATDLKTISPEIVRKRVLRTGDGSHRYSKDHSHHLSLKEGENEQEEHVWGWQDEMMSDDDKRDVTIFNRT